MRSILPELKRRRSRISQNHAWEQLPTGTSSKSKLLSVSVEEEERYGQIHLIPSVLARLKCLFRSLNVDHPQRSCIYQLVQIIENYDDTTLDEIVSDETKSFKSLLAAFLEVLKAHKLHGIVLRNAMHIKPADISGDNARYGKVFLYRYIGDMQITYFCLGHSVIIEGVSESTWMGKMSNILDKCENDIQVKVTDWYQLYLFFHSSYLRGCHLTPDFMIKLGLANESIVEFMTRGKVSQLNYLMPPRPFQGPKKMNIMDRIELCKHHSSVFSTVYEFGPLGPAFEFRGRDRVTRHTFTQLDREGEPVRALLHACIESKKINPMNVSRPLVTFDCKESK